MQVFTVCISSQSIFFRNDLTKRDYSHIRVRAASMLDAIAIAFDHMTSDLRSIKRETVERANVEHVTKHRRSDLLAANDADYATHIAKIRAEAAKRFA